MKHVRIAIAMLACSPVGLLAEDGPPGPDRREGRPPKDGRDFGKFIQAADTNGDKAVSLEEFSLLEPISKLPEEKRAELFKRLDRNGDGAIRKEEMRPPRRGWGGRQPLPPLRKLDTDGDRAVSFAEFEKGDFAQKLPEDRRRQFFDKLDRNKDGKLNFEDRPKDRGRPGRRPQGGLIGMLDKNDDEALSFEEFRQAPWLRDKGEDTQEDEFEKLDKNGDQLISKDEVPPRPPRRPDDGGEETPPGPPKDGE